MINIYIYIVNNKIYCDYIYHKFIDIIKFNDNIESEVEPQTTAKYLHTIGRYHAGNKTVGRRDNDIV